MSHHKHQTKRLKELEERHRSSGYHDPDQALMEGYDFTNMPEDRQYERMMAQSSKPHKKVKKSARNGESFFQSDPKYQAKKPIAKQPSEQYEEQDNNIAEESPLPQQNEQEQNVLAEAYKQLRKKNKLDTKLLDQKLKEINEEDEQVLQQIQSSKDTTAEQSEHLRNQFDLYKKLVEVRCRFEKTFQAIKRYPVAQNAPANQALNESNNKVKEAVSNNLSSLLNLSEKLTVKTGAAEPHVNKDIDDVELLYSNYRRSIEPVHKGVEKSIIKWSNKTALLSQISQSNYTSLLMQTPIGQAGKVLTSLDKVLPKSRLKRQVFRQLFAPAEDIKQSTNDQIFDDFELYHQLQREFEEEIIKDEDGLLIGASKKYLQERNSKSQADKKEVDRKASKNRKLRFEVFPKLVSFMTGQDNPHIVEAREEILKNLFNSGHRDGQQVDYIDM